MIEFVGNQMRLGYGPLAAILVFLLLMLLSIYVLNGIAAVRRCEGDKAALYQVFFLYGAWLPLFTKYPAAQFGISDHDINILANYSTWALFECLAASAISMFFLQYLIS